MSNVRKVSPFPLPVGGLSGCFLPAVGSENDDDDEDELDLDTQQHARRKWRGESRAAGQGRVRCVLPASRPGAQVRSGLNITCSVSRCSQLQRLRAVNC